MKYISFGMMGAIAVLLAGATIVEKLYGRSVAYEELYTSPFVIAIWVVMTICGIAYMISQKSWKRTATFILHLSFAVILTGATVTYAFGEQGRMHLRTDSGSQADTFLTEAGKTCQMPFCVSLKQFSLVYYEGTTAPMDYISTLLIDGNEASVSMNKIHRYKNYRFYQAGYDQDGKGTTLAILYDPWGIGITYTGYMLLLISMIAFFFQKHSGFRALLKHPSLRKTISVIITAACLSGIPVETYAKDYSAAPQTLSKETASEFGDLYIYYNNRICPLQTFAKDFTIKLYGKPNYKGLTSEQVLAGWVFYHDCWKDEPMIKIKGENAKVLLGISGKYACLNDYIDRGIYKLETALQNSDSKDLYAADEKFNLISMVCSGYLMKIFPLYTNDIPEWQSLGKAFPQEITDAEAEEIIAGLRDYQQHTGNGNLPTQKSMKAEKVYNTTNCNKPLAMLCMTLGIISFLVFCLTDRKLKYFRNALAGICVALFGYLCLHIGLRWYISGHIPLSNGFETMQFMAWCSLLICFTLRNKFSFALPFGILLCGTSLLVSMMGEATPRITLLMPVLQSPLLSIHVMVIMISYTLFAFMMLNGVAALIIKYIKGESNKKIEYLKTISNIMLYPAVFMLTAGIFIGAVWANISWGRYWGWDPKEVWALITMLVYSFGLHSSSIEWFRKPMNFHIFCILAFLSVLITYFGVNFLLGGLHSYA